jgi:hypothetical protein
MWYVLKLKSIEDCLWICYTKNLLKLKSISQRVFVNLLHIEYDVTFWVWVWICIGMFMYLLQSEMWCDMFLNLNRSKIVCEFVTHWIQCDLFLVWVCIGMFMYLLHFIQKYDVMWYVLKNFNLSKIVCEFVTHRIWCDILSLSLYRYVYVFVTIRNVMWYVLKNFNLSKIVCEFVTHWI